MSGYSLIGDGNIKGLKGLKLTGVTHSSQDSNTTQTSSSNYALTKDAVADLLTGEGLKFSSASIAAFGIKTEVSDKVARYAVSFCTPDGSPACKFTKPRESTGRQA